MLKHPEPIIHTTDQLSLGKDKTLVVPTWPKTKFTKEQLIAMVLEGCPHPRELHYVDLGETHGVAALH